MLQKLLHLGKYEDAVYRTLLTHDHIKALTLSRLAMVPHGRIYSVLESLIEKGIVSRIPTQPAIYVCVSPDVLLAKIRLQQEQELNDLSQELQIKKEARPREQPRFLILESTKHMFEMIAYMQEQAKKEILSIPGIFEPSASLIRHKLQTIRRGIKMRVLLHKITPQNRNTVQTLTEVGVLFRKNHFPGMRMVIIDRKEILISLVSEDEERTISHREKTPQRISLYSTNTSFAHSMAQFFDALWKESKEIKINSMKNSRK